MSGFGFASGFLLIWATSIGAGYFDAYTFANGVFRENLK
ncbi:MAG: hypothetical protein CM15mP64_0360 [Candidatus Neomarinimicrobiota bacterium]|nr:MAG: hypothetical protein CM15mP64_0360 [Candidatus Neomarinimicrobiota bacterium]